MSDASGSGGRGSGGGAADQPDSYRRPLGGLWWAALILVPFTMGLTAWFVFGPKGGDQVGATPSPSVSQSVSATSAEPSATSAEPSATTPTETSAAPSQAPSSQAPTSEPPAASGSFCVKRDGNTVTLCGVVADEAAKQAAEDTVKAKLPGVTIDNQITVAEGGATIDTAQLGAYLEATKDSTNASLDFRDGTVTLNGTVANGAAGAAAAAAAKALFPGAELKSNLTEAKPTGDPCDRAAVSSALRKIGKIQFAATSATLDAKAKGQVDQAAGVIKACGKLSIDVKGFTDNTGTWEKNLALSQQRADAVKAELVAKGVPANSIRALGHGWRYPAVPNNSAANKALNHRAEISIR